MNEIARLVLVDYNNKRTTLARLRGQPRPTQSPQHWEKDAAEFTSKCLSGGVNPFHRIDQMFGRAVLLGHLNLPALAIMYAKPDNEDNVVAAMESAARDSIRADMVKVSSTKEDIRILYGTDDVSYETVLDTLSTILRDPVVRDSYCQVADREVSDRAKIEFCKAPTVYRSELSGNVHPVLLALEG